MKINIIKVEMNPDPPFTMELLIVSVFTSKIQIISNKITLALLDSSFYQNANVSSEL